MTATPEVDSPSSASSIRNPATGAVAGQVRWTDPADVPRLAAGLREAQREWEERGAKGRAKVLARYAVWLGEHRDEIESLLIKETGKSATDILEQLERRLRNEPGDELQIAADEKRKITELRLAKLLA